MAKVFKPKPLFDAHVAFVRLPSGLAMLREYPDALEFVEQQRQQRPETLEDFIHTQSFLKSYSRKNEATYRSYRNEVERLLLWSWTVANKSIVQLRRGDLEAFSISSIIRRSIGYQPRFTVGFPYRPAVCAVIRCGVRLP